MMKYRKLIFALLAALALFTSCSDDDSFTTSPSRLLTFSTDTVRLDTVFSNVPSRTRDFWVYNRSGEGIRCANIRLERGNQTGFRVNVDGSYLGASTGFQINNVEVRNKDSIRVFVEVTTPSNYAGKPYLVDDNLVFTLESGAVQKVNLNTFSWDAQLLHHVKINRDSVISSGATPIIIYGGITVEEGATLTIAAGTTLYFHADAGIDVFGRLRVLGEPDANVTLRGDRIDRLFANLPYDHVSGQWRGIRFHSSSYDNLLQYADIHSTFDGVVVDSSDVSREKLVLGNSTIHNCQGYGLRSVNSRIRLTNCQITNALNDCLSVDGGWAEVNACTLAQFYPFDINRGVAMRFEADQYPLEWFVCQNSLVTGAADDQIMGAQKDTTKVFNYHFAYSILRTPAVDDSLHFVSVEFENVEDTSAISGKKHFANLVKDYLYDFRLDSLSPAIGKGNPATSPVNDRLGRRRKEQPDVGAFEFLIVNSE